MHCLRCGRTNAEGASFCSGCGATLAPDAESTEQTVALPQSFGSITGPDAPTQAALPPHTASGPALSVGQILGDRYEIAAVIGQGGCGVVYRAHDRALDRTVALKTIHPAVAANPLALERFKREILLASKITHRHVVRIHDLGELDNLKFISMEFIEGTNLKEILERDGAMDQGRAVELVRQIGSALVEAHEAGIVHRDIKPQNILVDGGGRAYIADFGISRSIDHGQTMTEAGAVLGTVAYMAPEQARGELADHRSDIYALGLIFYEMLTGAPPFQSDNALSQLMKRVTQEVPTVELARTDLAPWVARVVARCVARDPAERYQSVRELLADLEVERATRAPRRRFAMPGRRTATFASAGLLVALLLAVAYGWWNRVEEVGPVPVRASLLIVPFRNVSGDARDSWLSDGLPDLLRAELASSRDLRLADPARAREILDRLSPGGGGSVNPADLVTVSRLADVESLLVGELIRAGETFRVNAELLRVGASSVASRQAFSAEGYGEDSLFAIVDELGRQVRDELKLDRPWGGDRDVSRVSTHSVDALRLYTEAAARIREGADVEAAERLEQAIAADPEFWSARALLAEALDRLGRGGEALEQIDLAAAGLSDVSPYEAARIRALRAAMSQDVEAARRAHRAAVEIAPNLPESHLALAAFLEEQGALDEAREALDRALALDRANPQARYLRGRVLAKLGQQPLAVEDFEAARRYHVEAGNAEGHAAALMGLGNVRRSLGERDLALDHYEKALALRRERGDARGAAAAMNNIALIFQDQGQYERARESWQQVLEVHHDLDDREGEAEIHANLGDLEAARGRPQQALEHYTEGLRLLRGTADTAGQARALANLGFVNQVLGRYDESYLMLEQALAARRDRGDAEDLTMSLLDMGNLELILGHPDEALSHYVEAAAIARQAGDRDAELALEINLALVHLDRADYGAASNSAKRAVAAVEDGGLAGFRAAAWMVEGRVRAAIGDLGGAERALDEAIRVAEESGNQTALAEASIELGRVQVESGSDERASASFERALTVSERTQERRLMLPARIGLAAAEGSEKALAAALVEARKLGLAHHAARAALSLAELRLSRGRRKEAAEDAALALELAPPAFRNLRLRAHGVAARALPAGEAAAAHAREGLALLEAIVADLDEDPEAARTFLERRTPVIARDIESALDSSSRARLAALTQPS